MMPLLTLFTAPKPFVNPHISLIQHNTLQNWKSLGDAVEIVVIGDEPGIAEVCEEFSIRHIPEVRCNELGTPLISSIFQVAREVNRSPYLAYSNADILFMPEIIDVIHALSNQVGAFLGVGQRWDVDIPDRIDFTNQWEEDLASRIHQSGQLHTQTGSDYFIYPRICFKHIPDFAVGRAGWDNWMIFWARWQHWPVVDLSKTLTVIHQNHDYSHLPGSRKHYELPETAVNVKLAGGRRSIFNLTDATHTFDGHSLHRRKLRWQTFWREVEIFPLIRLHSRILGWCFFAFFHPVKAYGEVKGWLAYKLKRNE